MQPTILGDSGHGSQSEATFFKGPKDPWAPESLGRTKKDGQSKKKKVEKPQDGCQKSSQNIGNPYQMEANKAPPLAVPQGDGGSCRPLGPPGGHAG